MNKNHERPAERYPTRAAGRGGSVTPAKLKTSEVAPGIKAAIDALLHMERYDLVAAAKVGGVSAQRLRDDLQRPNVRAWMRQRRQAQLEQICLQNPSALARIRDSSLNATAQVNSDLLT
jgi:hypothetical protein